jgi:hypothetical protein
MQARPHEKRASLYTTTKIARAEAEGEMRGFQAYPSSSHRYLLVISALWLLAVFSCIWRLDLVSIDVLAHDRVDKIWEYADSSAQSGDVTSLGPTLRQGDVSGGVEGRGRCDWELQRAVQRQVQHDYCIRSYTGK